jgi:hypothetical protein
MFRRSPARPRSQGAAESPSLEEIHQRVRALNARLWKELRTGVLAGCYVGLYHVRLGSPLHSPDWREVNRKTVSALHRLETARSDEERCQSLSEALETIRQKLQLVKKAAWSKAARLCPEEERELQRNEMELQRLSRFVH